MQRTFKTLVVVVLFLLTVPAYPGNVIQNDAYNVAANWISYSARAIDGNWNGVLNPSIDKSEHLISDSDTLAYVFQVDPSGYVVVSGNREMTPVIAYSTTEHLDLESEWSFAGVLRTDLSKRNKVVEGFLSGDIILGNDPNGLPAISKNYEKWDLWSVESFLFIEHSQYLFLLDVREVGPLLQSSWHQRSPYNRFCPIGNGGRRCVVGCVATATAQIMRYWQWPDSGIGSHTYYWAGDGDAPGQDLYADFSDPYDWDNILLYYAPGYTQEEADAVAELCYEVGVAFNMMYHAGGSGAFLWRCLWNLPQFFRYEDNVFEERRIANTAESWFALIQDEINNGQPILYGIFQSYSGHAIVCDGWRISGEYNQVHMNYGWGGSYNNWYTVDNLYHSEAENDIAYCGIRPTHRTLWYVCADSANSSEDGSPANPFLTIQSAIDTSFHRDTVLVMEGLYVENINFNGKGILVASGYIFTDDTLDIQNTVIDGASAGPVVIFENNENHASALKGFIIQNGYAEEGGGIYCNDSRPTIASNIIVDNSSSQSGGGVYCENSDPRIVNVTISGNSSVTGGGVYGIDSSPIITNIVLWANSAQNDPEIHVEGASSPDISYSDISGGWAGIGNIDSDPLFRDPGNGDFHLMTSACGDPDDSPCIDAGHPEILDNILDCSRGLGTENSDMGAYGGGYDIPYSGVIISIPEDYPSIQEGIDASNDGDTVLIQPGIYFENLHFINRNIVIGSLFLTTDDASYISSTVIDGNSTGSVVSFTNGVDSTAAIIGLTLQNGSAVHGGGIYCLHSNPKIISNIITGNSADSSAGGIYCNFYNSLIINNKITGNSALRGGGIYGINCDPLITNNIICSNTANNGGGIYCRYECNSIISNNIIYENTASSGGGIYCHFGTPLVINNTISGNSVSSGGGGIYSFQGDLTINNTIIWGNENEIGLYAAYPVVTYCDIQGGWSGESNIDCDPWFCYPDTGDFYLEQTSCCLGAGENGVDIGALGIGCTLYGSISGIVTNESSDPVEGAYIEIVETEIDDTTDIDGAYDILGLLPGFYDIEASKYLYAIETITDVEIIAGQVSVVDIQLTGLPSGSISGIVTNEDGTVPVEGVLIRALLASAEITRDVTGSDGYYILQMEPGFYDIEASKEFYYTEIVEDVEVITDQTTTLAFQLSRFYVYLPGDANMYNGAWPPYVIGADVTYLVGYFIGSGQVACYLDGFWASADINGDCSIIGSDVTALVSYFVGGGTISYCPHYEPAWPPIPDNPPSGWPNCDTQVINSKIIPIDISK